MLGSTWKKWDLHIHSPLTYLNNNFRCDIYQFVEQVAQAGLSVIGVTNYWFFKDDELEAIRAVIAERGLDITVFGNLEFRISQPNKSGEWINIHCLFAEHVTTSRINSIVARMKLINTTECEHAIFCSEQSFRESQIDCGVAVVDFEKLCLTFEENLLVGQDYILSICPNGYGGYRPSPEGRSAAVATELDKKGHILFGRPQDREVFLRGDRFPGCLAKPVFHCSDAHSLEHIGEKYTWVKAVPSFQGLMQTLFEPADRVQQKDDFPERTVDKPYFHSITLDGDVFPGQAIRFTKQVIPLNPNMVAIIGGRGAGKSLFLDAMHSRLAICQGTPKVRNVAVESLRITISQGASNSHLNFDKDATVAYPYLHVSQGDVHSFSKDPSALSAEIKKMLGIRPSEFDTALSKELAENMGRYRAFVDFWRSSDVDGNKINTRKYQENVIATNSSLIATLTNPENSQLIKEYQENNSSLNEQSNFSSRSHELRALLERTIHSLNEQILTYNTSSYALTKVPLIEFDAALQALAANEGVLAANISALSLHNERIKGDFVRQGIKQDVSSLLSKIAEYQENIDGANAKLEEIASQTKLFLSDKARRAEISGSYSEYLEKLRSEIDVAYGLLLQPNSSWNSEQNELVQDMLSEISISGVVVFDVAEFYSGLEQCVNRGKFRTSSDRSTAERLAATFNVRDKETFLRLVMGQPVITLEPGASADNKPISLEEFFWKGEYFNQGGQFELFDYLYSPLRIKKYLYVNAEFSYKGKSVEKLSVGQRGTFYVCLKLATDPFGSPFVFDQPEDDLDNDFIMGQLVPLFKRIKKYRQVIIVTHNANLVVNSDAEQVIVAENDGEILSYQSGALEEGNVKTGTGIRALVCSILEGGHEAFSKRERKYGIGG